jgi:sugar lactone lactonase YvrE
MGGGINGPWDMTALDGGDQALLFVTNVLNGDVTTGAPHAVDQGTVLRLALEVPKIGAGMPTLVSTTVIGSEFPETADPDALVIGPTGLGLGEDGTLYVADSLTNRIAAITDAVSRTTTANTGMDVSVGGALMDPLGLAIAPNGDIVSANGGDGNLVETTPQGDQIAVKTVETATGAGSLFGIAIAKGGRTLYFVDDGDNTLKALTNAKNQEHRATQSP